MARREQLEPDDRVPGFRDISEIGRGALATVYQAVEIDSGRPVALKVLKGDAVHPQLTETFRRDVQALAPVSDHPNIVTFYRSLTTSDGRQVLVLELCRESLAERLQRDVPLGARDVTRIGVKIAGALETAHRSGFLHRDLKPQNVLVTRSGEPALGDLGLAALQSSARSTAGRLGFTTLHAPPEILEGNDLSPATDVYGLASTLYQALTGVAPFATFDNETPASVILRIIRDPVRPIRAEGIPIALSDLLEAALAKDPAARPATAAAFADSLNALEQDNGWPATLYAVRGQAHPSAPHETAAPTAPPKPPPVAPAGRPGPVLSPSAPSVQIAEVSPRRPMVPIDIGPAATGVPPVPPPEIVELPRREAPHPPGTARSSDAEAHPDLRMTPPAEPPPALGPAQPPPPPPARSGGRGLAPPQEGGRHVVMPDQSGRGPETRPFRAGRNSDLPPLMVETGATRSSHRPTYVDPPTAGATTTGPPSARDARYEQRHTTKGSSTTAPGRPVQAMVVAATLGLAVAVVILGILLLAGVL